MKSYEAEHFMNMIRMALPDEFEYEFLAKNDDDIEHFSVYFISKHPSFSFQICVREHGLWVCIDKHIVKNSEDYSRYTSYENHRLDIDLNEFTSGKLHKAVLNALEWINDDPFMKEYLAERNKEETK